MNITIQAVHSSFPWTNNSGNVAHYCYATDATGAPRLITISMKNPKYFPQPGMVIDVNFTGQSENKQEYLNGVPVLDSATGQPRILSYEKVSRIDNRQGGGQQAQVPLQAQATTAAAYVPPAGAAAPVAAPVTAGAYVPPVVATPPVQHGPRIRELAPAQFFSESAALTVMSFVALVTAAKNSEAFVKLEVPLDTSALWEIAGNHAYGASMGLNLKCIPKSEFERKNAAALAAAAKIKADAEEAARLKKIEDDRVAAAALTAAAPATEDPYLAGVPVDEDIPF